MHTRRNLTRTESGKFRNRSPHIVEQVLTRRTLRFSVLKQVHTHAVVFTEFCDRAAVMCSPQTYNWQWPHCDVGYNNSTVISLSEWKIPVHCRHERVNWGVDFHSVIARGREIDSDCTKYRICYRTGKTTVHRSEVSLWDWSKNSERKKLLLVSWYF